MKTSRTIDFLILGGCAGLALIAIVLNSLSPIAQSIRAGERITAVLIGSDYEDNARHSDTLMLVSYDPRSRFLDVLSIPRDTMITVTGMPQVRRINEVFTYEFRHSGKNFMIASMALKSVVETLLSSGTAQAVDIPYFFTIDYKGFRSAIDAMGGITIKVTEPMHYDDNWGNLHIHFDPGIHRMNGKQALEYVRFRGKSADSGRVLRQQLFIKELARQIKRPQLLWRFPQYAQAVWSGFHTNISAWDFFGLLIEARHMKPANIRPFSLPGAPHGNLWKMNMAATGKIIGMMKSAPPARKSGRTAESVKTLESLNDAPTVEVWNASNQPNMARFVASYLRRQGFDVVRYGPFATRQERTLIVDRSGQLRPAQQVAKVLARGSFEPEVVSRVDISQQVDAWVLIGNDFVLPE